MEVILTQGIRGLGALGERVNVKPGYARNYLIPTGKALLNNDQGATIFEAQRKKLEAAELERAASIKLACEKVAALSEPLMVHARASREGRLYAAVSSRNLIDLVFSQSDVKLQPSQVHLSTPRLREIGKYEVVFEFSADLMVTKPLLVLGEDMSPEDLEKHLASMMVAPAEKAEALEDGAPEDGALEGGAPEDGALEDGAPEDGALEAEADAIETTAKASVVEVDIIEADAADETSTKTSTQEA